MRRKTVRYSGQVQGVGFRATTRSVARGHAVSGYVRNLPDGRVEIVAEGEEGEIDAFLKNVEGRMAPCIRGAEVDASPATGEFDGFGVRY